ncbi:MAG: hypothetical protein R3B81_12605 [bacterium]|nr:hypothetical protein [Gemmatimonadota bacterium]
MERFEIYGRRSCDEALTHLGSLDVPNADAVTDAAKKAHGEDWMELVAIPAGQIAWAIEEDDA